MNYKIHADARQEFVGAIQWYSERSISAPENFQLEVENSIDVIVKDPGRHQAAGDGARVFRLKKFPYKIYYTLEDSTVVILAIMHNKRRPDYWRERLK